MRTQSSKEFREKQEYFWATSERTAGADVLEGEGRRHKIKKKKNLWEIQTSIAATRWPWQTFLEWAFESVPSNGIINKAIIQPQPPQRIPSLLITGSRLQQAETRR